MGREGTRRPRSVDRSLRRLTSIRGVGPGIARFFLRDAVWLSGAASDLRREDRHRLQPTTTWVARTARLLWPELGDADDETLAKRIVEACAENGVCPVAFNQGVWYFARETLDGDAERLEAELRRMRTGDRPPQNDD
ncbi:hypothetical protein [Halorussus sp. MSC15.2]|uniref:hypothetical protein n=1 Tax=Halorussus sp. MSC15.2 TaxID=2283638 RepID=UPI0013D84EDA|nr:hypothetical protein [Halorussus sp. MSC15.2]NEU56664.1 hypothetical protein [Halorussus sp. MSC15.2]